MNQHNLKFKYSATVRGIIFFYALLLLNISFLILKKTDVQSEFKYFFSHISNFIITSILMSAISLIWLLQGVSFKVILWLGVIAVALNFIIELFVHVMNTTDIIDAIYGTAGVVITTLVMLLIKKSGLKSIQN